MIVEGSPVNPNLGMKETLESDITISGKDTAEIYPHDKDFIVITIRCDDWEIKRELVDRGSFADTIY